MNATQDPKRNAIDSSHEQKSTRTPAERQKNYRLRLQTEAKAYRAIKAIIDQVEAES